MAMRWSKAKAGMFTRFNSLLARLDNLCNGSSHYRDLGNRSRESKEPIPTTEATQISSKARGSSIFGVTTMYAIPKGKETTPKPFLSTELLNQRLFMENLSVTGIFMLSHSRSYPGIMGSIIARANFPV